MIANVSEYSEFLENFEQQPFYTADNLKTRRKMKTIMGVSFENWVCADKLLGWGLSFAKVSEILGVDKPII